MSRRDWLTALLLPICFGLLAAALGKDDNWDLLRYHYYNPHAWLHGRNGHDLLAADFHVYFNPLLDLPFYLGNQFLPGVALTFLLGALHGMNGVLLWRIATHQGPILVLHTPSERGRPFVEASLARHRLTADFAACGQLATSIGGPLALCPVQRGP